MNISITYKHITALIFLVAFVAQTFSKAFVIAGYYANTAAFAKNCINKARPALKCHGKCQVMKKLVQEEKQEQENPERKAAHKNEVLVSSKSFFAAVPVSLIGIISSKKLYSAIDGNSIDRHYKIFHPPQQD